MSEIFAGDDLWLRRTASMIKFREIRRKIARMLEIDESTISPRTRLAAIVPPYRRNEILKAILKPDLPHRKPVPSQPLPIWFAEIIVTTLLSFLFLFQPWFLVLLTLPVSLLIANRFRQPQSTVWPPCFETMHELAVSQVHFNRQDAVAGLWPREEISAKVRWIIANQLGERFEEITEQTRFADL